MAGDSVSLMVTVNVQLVVLLHPSVAVQITDVTPFGNVLPDGGTQPVVTVGHPPLVETANVTLLLVQSPGSVDDVMSLGQVIEGPPPPVITTVTLKLQLVEFNAASVAEQFTVVVPGENVLPDGGVQFVVTPGQLSPKVNPQLTVVIFVTSISLGQAIVGRCVSATVTVCVQTDALPE